MARIANEHLRNRCPELIELFGEIGSEKWWKFFDSGNISREINIGSVISIEPDIDDDRGPAVNIQTSQGTIAYDYDGIWKTSELVIGSLVEIVRVKSIVYSRTGPVTTFVDVTIEIKNC